MALSEADLSAFVAFERAGWERAAEPYHQLWGGMSRQSAEAMLDAAHVGAGSRVLDVACGAGYLASAAMARGATALGVDFSSCQVKLASRTFPRITFQKGEAENLQFEADEFTAVLMGFGMNHLPSPERGFDEAFRVLRSGGYFAFTVWAKPEQSAGFGIMLGAIERFGEPAAKLPAAPPYFRFSDAQEAKQAFLAAGFVEPEVKLVPQYWLHSSPDQLFDAFDRGAVRATAMLRVQPECVRDRIRESARDEVTRLKDNGVYRVGMPAVLSVARKP